MNHGSFYNFPNTEGSIGYLNSQVEELIRREKQNAQERNHEMNQIKEELAKLSEELKSHSIKFKNSDSKFCELNCAMLIFFIVGFILYVKVFYYSPDVSLLSLRLF